MLGFARDASLALCFWWSQYSSEGSMHARQPSPPPTPPPIGRFWHLIGRFAIASAVYWRQPLVDVTKPRVVQLEVIALLDFASRAFSVFYFFLFFFFSALVACYIKLVMLTKLCLIFSWIWRSPVLSLPPPPFRLVGCQRKGSRLCVALSPPKTSYLSPPPLLLLLLRRFFSFVPQWWKHLHEACVQSKCMNGDLHQLLDLISLKQAGEAMSLWYYHPSTVTFPVWERAVLFLLDRKTIRTKLSLATWKKKKKTVVISFASFLVSKLEYCMY